MRKTAAALLLALGLAFAPALSDAQAVLRADPTDPNRLDQGGIPGVACESNRAPKDTVPVAP